MEFSFRKQRKGKKWFEKGVSALEEEMAFHVYPDGVCFKGSISYHRLVTELFLSATLLCLKNCINFPSWYMNRLEKMIEFVMRYTKPDGTAPQIGDNDDGRLHILSNYENWDILDHRYLLSIGAVLFKTLTSNHFREHIQSKCLIQIPHLLWNLSDHATPTHLKMVNLAVFE